MKRLLQLLVFLLGLASLAPSFARQPDLRAPLLLAAAPGLSGPYGQSVVLALPAGNGMHYGFILNRPTQTDVAAALPEVPDTEQLRFPIYLGGPNLSRTLIALTLAPQPPTEKSVQALPGLYMDFGIEQAVQAALHAPQRTRFFAGLVAWEAGELQAELSAGAWYALEPDLNIVVGDRTETLWQRIVDRMQMVTAMR